MNNFEQKNKRQGKEMNIYRRKRRIDYILDETVREKIIRLEVGEVESDHRSVTTWIRKR